jgi:hypothetical protein
MINKAQHTNKVVVEEIKKQREVLRNYKRQVGIKTEAD